MNLIYQGLRSLEIFLFLQEKDENDQFIVFLLNFKLFYS